MSASDTLPSISRQLCSWCIQQNQGIQIIRPSPASGVLLSLQWSQEPKLTEGTGEVLRAKKLHHVMHDELQAFWLVRCLKQFIMLTVQ